MTIGLDTIGRHAVGEMLLQSGAPLIYPPVSRLASGAYSPGAQLVTLGVDLEWDNGDPMTWDNDESIGWEA
jgi:hypothetical protein